MLQSELELKQARREIPPEKWEDLSREGYLRQRFEMFRVSRDVVNKIIMIRLRTVIAQAGKLEQVSMMYGYNQKGYITCGWKWYGKQCKRRPNDCIMWVPNLEDDSEERKKTQGSRAWVILLCLLHQQTFREDTEKVSQFVKEQLVPLRESQIMESHSNADTADDKK